MKKALIVLLSLILIIIASGCTGNASRDPLAQNPASTIKKVKDKKKLVIGTGITNLPFEMIDKQGDPIGYDVDLGKAMGKALGVEVEFKQMKFGRLIPALQNGDIDLVVAAMIISGDRALAVSFSKPYFTAGQILMVPKTDTATTTWKELDVKGKQIAASQGTAGALLAKQLFKQATVQYFENEAAATLAISQGQADGMITDESVVRDSQKKDDSKVKGIYEIISSENLGIATALNDMETVLWLNSFVDAYKNSPDEKASMEKWFESTDWKSNVEENK
jgi:polar amino acid transport system substrate-binding protein